MAVVLPERFPAVTDPEKASLDKSKSAAPSIDSATDLHKAEPPDGGLRAWTAVFGGWCVLFTSFGWIDCIGIFQSQYQTDQLRGYTPGTIAWITSVEASMMYISAPLFGKIYDNYGPAPLLYGGTAAHVLGLMMASLSQEYYQFFLAQSLCSALGAAAVFYAGNNVIGTWFLRNRALAYGIVASGASVSGFLLPIMVTRLLPAVGFGWTMRICAFVFLFTLLLAMGTVKARTRPKAQPWELRAFVRPLGERLFLLNALGNFFFFWGLFVPFNFIVLAAQYNGMSQDLAFYQIAILNGASVFGRIIPGWLGDRIGRFNIMIITTLLSTILVLALWIPASSPTSIIVFSALFGCSSGTFVSMAPALVQEISKVDEIGMRMGTSYSIISIAVLTGNPIAGALITRNGGGYLYLQLFCGMAMGIGCGFLLAARYVQCGWTLKRI